MLNLNDREWKEFELNKLFIIKGSKTTSKKVLETYGDGEHPYVTTQTTQNGQAAYYNKHTESGNVLVVDSAVAGFCTYQGKPFSASDHVEKLIPKFNMNKYSGLFFSLIINQNNIKKYSYGYKACQERLAKTKIMLPIDNNGNPDYEFMEQYIKEQENRKRAEYIQHIKNELHDIEYREIKKWEELEWKDFQLGNLFEICRGNAKGISNLKDNGETAIISALDNNNGFYLSTDIPDDEKTYKHRLTVNNNGNGVCLSYYHDYNFVASSDVSILSPKRKELSNKYVCLFISTAIRQQKIKYCYGYKMNNTRMENQIICLPINANNEPDYEYMEQYVKNNIYLKNIQYLIERGIENSNYKIARLYTEGYGIVTSILPSNNSPEDSARYVFDLKARKLLITLDFAKPDNFDFFLSNILSTEIINAVNTGAISLKFRTSNPTEMDKFSEGYDDRTNLALSYLTKYKINIPENKYDIWNKN